MVATQPGLFSQIKTKGVGHFTGALKEYLMTLLPSRSTLDMHITIDLDSIAEQITNAFPSVISSRFQMTDLKVGRRTEDEMG